MSDVLEMKLTSLPGKNVFGMALTHAGCGCLVRKVAEGWLCLTHGIVMRADGGRAR